jgi:hypothetical protein
MFKVDLLAANQACMIYLIMCIIDPSSGNEQHSQELLLALHVCCDSLVPSNQYHLTYIQDLYILFKQSYCVRNIPGEPKPAASWEEWIFAESQRRYVTLLHTWPLLVRCI